MPSLVYWCKYLKNVKVWVKGTYSQHLPSWKVKQWFLCRARELLFPTKLTHKPALETLNQSTKINLMWTSNKFGGLKFCCTSNSIFLDYISISESHTHTQTHTDAHKHLLFDLPNHFLDYWEKLRQTSPMLGTKSMAKLRWSCKPWVDSHVPTSSPQNPLGGPNGRPTFGQPWHVMSMWFF